MSFKAQWLIYIPPELPLRNSGGRSLAGIVGSNLTGVMVFVSCKFWLFSSYRLLRRADPSSRGVLPIVCVPVTECDQMRQTPFAPTVSRQNRSDKKIYAFMVYVRVS